MKNRNVQKLEAITPGTLHTGSWSRYRKRNTMGTVRGLSWFGIKESP